MKNQELPAYPFLPNRPWDNESANGFAGLTKREYFAGLAMQSYFGGEFTGQLGMPKEMIADICVEMADALLERLEK